jgi:hypothetical protein
MGIGVVSVLLSGLAAVALGMILYAVHKIRPRRLRFTASAARWLSLTLEIEGPQRSAARQPPSDR